MARRLQSAAATPDQVDRLNQIAASIGIDREDFEQGYDGSTEIRSWLSREEARGLGRLAFDLDTSVAALTRGAVRSMLRKVMV